MLQGHQTTHSIEQSIQRLVYVDKNPIKSKSTNRCLGYQIGDLNMYNCCCYLNVFMNFAI